MANYKNSKFYEVSNAKDTIPASVTGTGTVSTKGIYVTGVGTKFMSLAELGMGFWICDLANDEIRKVDGVDSDTVARLTHAFTADLSADPLIIVKRTDLDIRQVSVSIDGTLTDGEIDGVALLAGNALAFGKPSDSTRGSYSFIDPLIADATGTVINVTILK